MTRRTAIAGMGLVAAAAGQTMKSPLQAKNGAEKRVLTVLEDIDKNAKTSEDVPMVDGRMIRLLAETSGARNALEIGTSFGCSCLWLCLALQSTGGQLTTFEIDPRRAAMARERFQRAGVDQRVRLVVGDAHREVAKQKGPLDLVFIDADKEGYPDYLKQILPLVRPGGLILAHDIDSAEDYVAAVSANPELETVFYMEGQGLGITLKKR
ncbi:MAG: O-methyltransferase [Acidobacteria bacterium]|nr:O-methyltransferase [Acidobacteriota bacterium]